MLDKVSMKKRNNMVVNYYLAKAFEKLDLPEQGFISQPVGSENCRYIWAI